MHCVSSPSVNRSASTNMWTLLAFILLLGLGTQAVNASSSSGTDTCVLHINTPAWFIQEIPFSSLDTEHRKGFSFSVTTCHDAHLVLSSGTNIATSQTYEIVIGGWENSRSMVRNCVLCDHDPVKKEKFVHEPLSCNESRSFYVDWEDHVIKVGKVVKAVGGPATRATGSATGDATGSTTVSAMGDPTGSSTGNAAEDAEGDEIQKEPFLTYEDETILNISVGHVFVHNFYGKGAEWQIDVPCSSTESPDSGCDKDGDGVCNEESHEEEQDGVSRGHLAGAVIVALLAGLGVGVCSVYFGPKLWTKWSSFYRERKDTQQKKEEARDAEELASLVTQQPPPADKVPGKDTPGSAIPRPPSDLLPSAPTPTGASPAGKKPGNAYTPYHSMHGESPSSSNVKKSDDVASDVKNLPGLGATNAARKNSRATAPLPELPTLPEGMAPRTGNVTPQAGKGKGIGKEKGGKGKDVEAEPPEEMYANQDANVYEGVRHELPIYENREMRMYESLKKK